MSNYEVKGLEEMLMEIQSMAQRYPKTAKRGLGVIGRELREELAIASPASDIDHKRKLETSWKSRTKGEGSDTLQAEIYSRAPHFHLLNRGHVIKGKDGRVKGFKQGLRFLEKTVEKYVATNLEERVRAIMKSLVRKESMEQRKAGIASKPATTRRVSAKKKGRRK